MDSLGEAELSKSFTKGDQGSRMDRKASLLPFSVKHTPSSNRDPEARQFSRTPEGISLGEGPSRRSSSSYLRGYSSVPRTKEDQAVESRRRHSWNDTHLTQDPAWQVEAAHIPARLKVPFLLLFRWQPGKDSCLFTFPIFSRKYTHIEPGSHATTVIVSPIYGWCTRT